MVNTKWNKLINTSHITETTSVLNSRITSFTAPKVSKTFSLINYS